MNKNVENIFDALTETFGAGKFNENTKHQILLNLGQANDTESVYKSVNKVLGEGTVSESLKKKIAKRVGGGKPVAEEVTRQDKQQRDSITDTGEDKDVNTIINEAYNPKTERGSADNSSDLSNPTSPNGVGGTNQTNSGQNT